MADELRIPPTGKPPESARPQFSTDTTDISTVYANICWANCTPEEVILDFGLDPIWPPTPGQTVQVKLTHRVVMSPYAAKRLLTILAGIVERHEATFGELELDIGKRARSTTASAKQ